MFNTKLQLILDSFNMNQSELALKTGVSQSTISKYLKGERSPDFIFINNLINNLGIDPYFIFFDFCSEITLKSNLYFQALQTIDDKNKKDELNMLLQNFLASCFVETFADQIIEKIKGKNFFEKFAKSFHGEGLRKLRLLYFMLLHIKNCGITPNEKLKEQFVQAVQTFNMPQDSNMKYFFSFKERDKRELIQIVCDEIENSLDEVSIFEIITSLDLLISKVQERLNFVDQFVIQKVSK